MFAPPIVGAPSGLTCVHSVKNKNGIGSVDEINTDESFTTVMFAAHDPYGQRGILQSNSEVPGNNSSVGPRILELPQEKIQEMFIPASNGPLKVDVFIATI